MKIGVGLCFYNDLESLKHSIPTYSDKVDYIFAIDGRFEWFDSTKDYSDREVIEYLNSFDNVIFDRYVGLEHDKRNRYVKLASDYKVDALLIIDSDDYVLESDWDLFKKSIGERIKHFPEENFFGVDFRVTPPDFKPPEYTPYPRLWVRPEECSYYKAHCIFKGSGKVIRSSSLSPKIEGLKMATGDDYRTTEYLNALGKYQSKMLDYEIPIRQEYRV